MKVAVNITRNFKSSAVTSEIVKSTNNSMNNLTNFGMRESIAITPKRGGDLRRNKTKNITLTYGLTSLVVRAVIEWTSKYAAVQETGKRRGAKKFSRYTTAGTGAKYTEKTAKKIESNVERYF